MRQQSELAHDLAQLTERPLCPKCGTQMQLARIEPDKPGYDLRNYECPACHHLESMIVRYRSAA
jgi:ssDNA-binding Zn-finger/Zn-ribbon topoisomerase 1